MHIPRARPAVALVVIAAVAGCGSAGSPLSERDQLALRSRCVSLSSVGKSAFPSSACERIVATISDDIRDLGCDHDLADELLVAVLRNDRPAVRAIERSC